ncbi:MAG: serine/threonine-protein kinase [Byssovorax sp.]
MQTDRVGKYRIIAKLGQGGMATVFLSVVPGPAGVNKLLVIKTLKEDMAGDADFLQMFLNEARLAARLNHANVVQTYEIGFEAGIHFLAMDYLDGQSLHAVLRKATRQGLPLDIHLRILSDVLLGLEYAHTLTDFDGTPLAIVHRDVSPQNVFITYDGQVKLVDFGIAKAAGASTTTQSGVFKGKLAYVAPEQAGGEPVDARADLFSVGVMIWEAIAGQRFAQGDGQTAMLGRRLSGNEPRIRQVVPTVDPELADICDKAMAHRPEHRYLSARELHQALEGYLERSGRRVANRDVGDYLSQLFAEERGRIRQIIDEQMKRVMRETQNALPMPNLDVFPGVFDPTPITTVEARLAAERAAQALRASSPVSGIPGVLEPSPGSVSGMHGTLAAANVSQSPQPAKSIAPILISLAALGITLIGGLVVILVFFRSPASAQGTPSANVPLTGPTSPAAEKIKLSISFAPAGAVAKLDGVPLAESPFVAQVPRDGSMHRLDVEGPGLKPETRMVSYEKDVVLTVSLGPADAPTADPAVTATAPVLGGPFDPSKIPVRPKGKPLGIDEKDPYKK